MRKLAHLVAPLLFCLPFSMAYAEHGDVHDDPGDEPRAEWCQKNPEKCEKMKAKREAFCKDNPATCKRANDTKREQAQWCRDNPDECKQLKDERKAQRERQREKMKARCAENPERCEKLKEKMQKRIKKPE